MKKIILLFTISALITSICNAQQAAYSQGDNLLNVGIGINSYYSGGIPIGASYEKGITDAISAGVGLDYLSDTYGEAGNSYKFTAIYFGVRGSYHFNELLNITNDNIDIYAGATLGYRSFSWSDNASNIGGSYGSDLYLGIYVGGKYYFSPNVGGFLELGATGSTNARIGVAFKF